MSVKKLRRYTGVTKLANGRYRAIVSEPETGKSLSVATVLGIKGTTWATVTEAQIARGKALERLREVVETGVTLRQFYDRWVSDPLFARNHESTMIHNQERTRGFVAEYGHLAMS